MKQKANEPSAEALKKARTMLQDYAGAKLRIQLYERKRPTFMKQMKIDLSRYADEGIVTYDEDLAKKLSLNDWLFLAQYTADLENVWLIDSVLLSLDDTLKAFFKDAYQDGHTNKVLEAKYDIKERTVRSYKEKITRTLAGAFKYIR